MLKYICSQSFTLLLAEVLSLFYLKDTRLKCLQFMFKCILKDKTGVVSYSFHSCTLKINCKFLWVKASTLCINVNVSISFVICLVCQCIVTFSHCMCRVSLLVWTGNSPPVLCSTSCFHLIPLPPRTGNRVNLATKSNVKCFIYRCGHSQYRR